MLTSYQLYKLIFTSAASRNVYKYKTKYNCFWKSSKLAVKLTWNSGRNDSGTRVIRTRAALKRSFKTIKINYFYKYNKIGFVSNFLFIPYKNQILSLIRYAYGSFNYRISTENHKLFSLLGYLRYSNNCLFTLPSFYRLGCFANLSYICLIEIVQGKGAQYCRSSGTTAKVLKFSPKKLITLIKLPSGRSKAFSSLASATFSRVLFKENRKFTNSKAGYWRGFGFKSIVRGVAMNPVDHPHGGRTNSIRYPRTPWGKTTKFK